MKTKNRKYLFNGISGWDLNPGQFDAQDGPATSEAWIDDLDWPGREEFWYAERKIWRVATPSCAEAEKKDARAEGPCSATVLFGKGLLLNHYAR